MERAARRTRLLLLLMTLLACLWGGCGGKAGQEEAQKQESTQNAQLVMIQETLQQERIRSSALEQDVRDLQDEVAVFATIAFASVTCALVLLGLLLREHHGKRTMQKLIRLIWKGERK